MYKVQSGIEPKGFLPASGRPSKYPFKTMRPGDSFALPFKDKWAIQNAAKTFSRRSGYAVRFIFECEGDGWRCFCIAGDHAAS